MTSRDIAKHLIHAYVKRGDSLEWIQRSQIGAGCTEYYVSIGGYEDWSDDGEWQPEKIRKIPSTKIIVHKMDGKKINEIFSLKELYNEIEQEDRQLSLL